MWLLQKQENFLRPKTQESSGLLSRSHTASVLRLPSGPSAQGQGALCAHPPHSKPETCRWPTQPLWCGSCHPLTSSPTALPCPYCPPATLAFLLFLTCDSHIPTSGPISVLCYCFTSCRSLFKDHLVREASFSHSI